MKIKWERNSRALALEAQGKIKGENIIPKTDEGIPKATAKRIPLCRAWPQSSYIFCPSLLAVTVCTAVRKPIPMLIITHSNNDPIPVAAREIAPKRLTIAISVKPIMTRLKLLNIMGIAREITCCEILLSNFT